MKKLMKKAAILLLPLVGISLTSCVNEWPHPENLQYGVTLTVHSDTDWQQEYQMDRTRAEAYELEYKFQIFKDNDFSSPYSEFTRYSTDLSRSDFNIDLQLYPGEYTVYVWSDFVNPSTQKSLFYDIEDFTAITYTKPYVGNTDFKDAFRGSLSFTIEESMYLNPTASETINLRRPLGRYIFIANDLESFIQKENTRGVLRSRNSKSEIGEIVDDTRDLEEDLSDYIVKIYYPMFMPSVFNNYTDEPYDSWTGVSFEGKISPISDSEAALGLDFVMLPTSPSSVQVAMEIYDATGEKIGGTATLTVPMERDRTTIITGKFLTSQEDAGVAIDPEFNGQFNIKYQ